MNLSTLADGIPDVWKVFYGFDTSDITFASADYVGDGIANFWKYSLNLYPLPWAPAAPVQPKTTPVAPAVQPAPAMRLAAAPAVAAVPAPAPAPSISNGSFSTVTQGSWHNASTSNNYKGGGFKWAYVAAGGVAGWSALVGSEIEVWKTDSGEQFVELDASKGNHGITQQVQNATPGTYLLTWKHLGRKNGAAGNNAYKVMAYTTKADGSDRRDILSPPKSLPASDKPADAISQAEWKQQAISFTVKLEDLAPSGQPARTLWIALDSKENSTYGVLINDVRLLPFELSSDLNNDGKIDGTDSNLKTASLQSGASDDVKEKGMEYLLVDDKLSNGLWDHDDPKAPSAKKEDDDLQELKTVCAATFGAVWFEYEGGDISKLAFYRTKECKQTTGPNGDKMTFPFALSETNKLPEKLYARAEGNWTAQVEGKLVMKFGKADKTETWASDKLGFTVVNGLGDKKYFHAVRDYIMENNTLFFTGAKYYGKEFIRVTVMRQEATKMQALETYHRAKKIYGIVAVAAANPGQTLIVNGNFVFDINPGLLSISGVPRMTKRCNGRLITGGALDSLVSTDSTQAPGTKGASKFLCGDTAKYIAQSPDGSFTFALGQVPLNAGYLEALGGLSTNYAEREDGEANMIGQVVINSDGEKTLVFSAQSDPRVTKNGEGPGLVGFATDVGKAEGTRKQVFVMDGGSSVAMAYADPNATPAHTLTHQYGGVKHGTVIGYYPNTYLMFKCTRPRNP